MLSSNRLAPNWFLIMDSKAKVKLIKPESNLVLFLILKGSTKVYLNPNHTQYKIIGLKYPDLDF